jgi:glutamate:GABA antiporter
MFADTAKKCARSLKRDRGHAYKVNARLQGLAYSRAVVRKQERPFSQIASNPPSLVAGNIPRLRREMGVRDLTLFSAACMVSIRWISAAAHAGPSTIMLWLVASISFLVPLAIAVGTLTVKYPGAGGMYLWARNDFGPFHGFLCFWTYWLGIAVLFSGLAVAYMGMSAYALGPSLEHLTSSRTYVISASLGVIWLGLGLNIIGITVGKWTENLAGIASWLLVVLLVTIAVLSYRRQGSATVIHAAQLVPMANWGTVNFWASICYAVSGFEVAGMMGGEIRDPARTVPRAAWFSSAFIAVFYIFSTIALMVLLPSAQIDELGGVPQAGVRASQILGAAWLPFVIVVLIMAAAIGQLGGQGSATARMPFAAGVDHLLPRVFGRLHSRWKTPYAGMLAMGAVSTVLLVFSQLGDTMLAGYDTLVSLMVIAGFLPFFYIFLSAWKAGKRVTASTGGIVTAIAIVCAVVPTSEVHRIWLFELKILLGTVAIIGSAWLVYQRAHRTGASVRL